MTSLVIGLASLTPVALAGGQSVVNEARQATSTFHDVKKAEAAGYDLDKLEGLGLGEKSEAAAGEKDYGTLEDLFGLGRRFDAARAYERSAETTGADDRG